jgi:hypothetical protein
MTILRMLSVLMGVAPMTTACGSKGPDSTPLSTNSGAGGSASASQGSGGAGGSMCVKCSAFTQGNVPTSQPCSGKSAQLLAALVQCKCQSSEAGSCSCWCQKPAPMPCLDCLSSPSFQGTCNAERAACQADN